MSITYEQIQQANQTIKRVDIKGKQYAQVPGRIQAFRSLWPEGSIQTEIISMMDDVVVMKATISDETGRVLATGMAYEKESSSYINKTSYIENCVPIDTQILTSDGWKYYYQLGKDSKALSYNMETGKVEYCDILAVNVYDDHPLVELSTSRFHAICTPMHKWVVRSQDGRISKVETRDLRVSHKIIQNVRQITTAGVLGRKLGWLMCDCEISATKNGMPSTAFIHQAKHIEDVTALFGEPTTKMKKYNETWKDCYEWVIPSEEVRDILGHFGIGSYADLPEAMLRADLEDVAGCFNSMMLADGESRGFSSTYVELIEAVQIMCARLGIVTGIVKGRMMRRSTRPIYTLPIKKGDGAYFSEMEIKNLPPSKVWCPTTENGTWFMRQGDFVTLTSNCETSAVGRALGMLGIGSEDSVASSEEVTNAINNQHRDELISEKEQMVIESMCMNRGWDPYKIFTDKNKAPIWPKITKAMYTEFVKKVGTDGDKRTA